MNSGKSRFLGLLFLSLTVFGSLHAVVNFHFCHGELVSVGILQDAKKCWGFYEALERAAQEEHDEHIRPSCCDESKVVLESIVECEVTASADVDLAFPSHQTNPFLSRKTVITSSLHHYKNPLHHRHRHVLFENFRC